MKYIRLWKSDEEAVEQGEMRSPQVYYISDKNMGIGKRVYGQQIRYILNQDNDAVIDVPCLLFDTDHMKSVYDDNENINLVFKSNGVIGDIDIQVTVLENHGTTEFGYTIDNSYIIIDNHFDGKIRITAQSTNAKIAHDTIDIDIVCEDIKDVEYIVSNVMYPQSVNYDVSEVTMTFDETIRTILECGIVTERFEEHSVQLSFPINDTEEDIIRQGVYEWDDNLIEWNILQKKYIARPFVQYDINIFSDYEDSQRVCYPDFLDYVEEVEIDGVTYDKSVFTFDEYNYSVNYNVEGEHTITFYLAEGVDTICEEAFYYVQCYNVKLKGIKKLETEAFSYSYIDSIENDELESVGFDCFSFTPIEKVILPNVTFVGEDCFEDCAYLTSVQMDKAEFLDNYAFYDCYALTTITLPSVTEMGYDVFAYCGNLTSVSMESLTRIYKDAFYQCSALNEVNIPNAEYIEDFAFYYCYSLTCVDFPNLTCIENSAFCGSGLERVDFSNITLVYDSTFDSCNNLTYVNLPNVTSIDSFAFQYCANLETVELPNVEYMNEQVFLSCQKLSNISMNNVTYIGNYSFAYCESLTSVYTPNLETINGVVFEGCYSLSSVSMDSLKYIGYSSFASCDSLTYIELPSLEYVDSHVFDERSQDIMIYLPDTPPSITYDSFDDYCFFYVSSEDVLNEYSYTTNWSYIYEQGRISVI